jgi:hypothetical protein
MVQLDSRGRLPQHLAAAPVKSAANWLLALQAPASDHVVETARGRCGHHVRGFTLGEEQDASRHEALTLLNRKVTAQVNS